MTSRKITDESSRLQYVDISKFIGLTLVIITHTVYPDSFGNKYFSLIFIPIFFICSGYTTNTQHPINLKNKTLRLLLPYFIFSLLYVVVRCLSGKHLDFFSLTGCLYSRFSLFPLSTPDNVYFLRMSGPTWFFTALFTSFVLFKLLLHIPAKSIRMLLVLAYLLIAATIPCCQYYCHGALTQPSFLPVSCMSAIC